MRNAPNMRAEIYRDHQASMGIARSNQGAFLVPVPGAQHRLRVIISDGGGWDHVSVSHPGRCPTWPEMCFIKDLFFREDEVVMQLHPEKKNYINCHPYCLHLWRPQTQEERERDLAEYRRDREEMTEVERAALDPIEFAPTPGPIPLPPLVMVGIHAQRCAEHLTKPPEPKVE